MSTQNRFFFVEPLDVCIFRDNQLFGEPGSSSNTLMPPWPSVFAGAFRSEMLSVAEQSDPGSISRFSHNQEQLDGQIGQELGTPSKPGVFKLNWLSLATNLDNLDKTIPYLPLPRDLQVATEEQDNAYISKGYYQSPFENLDDFDVYVSKANNNYIIINDPDKPRSKASEDLWFDFEGFSKYLEGKSPNEFCESNKIYKKESRVGIGINPKQRTAEDGKLFTSQTVSFVENFGFLVGLGGATSLPSQGIIRLGGDARGAKYKEVHPHNDFEKNKIKEGKVKLVLLTPAIPSKNGYFHGLVPKDESENSHFVLQTDASIPIDDCPRLVATSIGTPQTISGWDIANQRPKDAQKVIMPGAVFWFDNVSSKGLEALQQWVESSLGLKNPHRLAEGFNRSYLANWGLSS